MDVYNLIKNHRSIRKYKDIDVCEDELRKIIECAIHAPSSINGQQWGIVVIRDAETKKKIAELSGGQVWVEKAPVFLLFVGDYSKAAVAVSNAGLDFENIDSLEATMVMSVDVGIAFANAMNCAESLGYGIVPIGGIRRAPDEMISLLDLPQYVYPIVGMCIGVPDEDPMCKPRFPYDSMVHNEKYDSSKTKEQVEEYDSIVREYMLERTGGKESRTWSDTVSGTYSRVYFPKVNPSLKKQGFENSK